MGTSAPFPGPSDKTPLLPDWADDDAPFPVPENDPLPDGQKPPIPVLSPPEIPEPEIHRFAGPRNAFTRWVHSNGTNQTYLGRSIGNYVRSGLGGNRIAAQRMSKSSQSSVALANFLRNVADQGIEKVLRDLSLVSLIGKPHTEVLLALTDIVCEPGGTIDEAIARDAYVETIIGVAALGDDFVTLTDDQVDVIVGEFITRSIVNRIFIDIGKSIDVGTLTGENALYLTQQTFEFVSGIVTDRLVKELENTRSLDYNGLRSAMKEIYRIGFELLQVQLGEL